MEKDNEVRFFNWNANDSGLIIHAQNMYLHQITNILYEVIVNVQSKITKHIFKILNVNGASSPFWQTFFKSDYVLIDLWN